MILGFLAEGPLHGYDLRQRMERLQGSTKPMSDGTLYPAIDRLERSGYVTRTEQAGARAATRHTLEISDLGHEVLLRRLRTASGGEITDLRRFHVILAFLSLLPDRAERDAVLRRRLDYLDQPASFFYDGDTPLPAAAITDPYRRGMLLSARALSSAERAWIREELASADGPAEEVAS